MLDFSADLLLVPQNQGVVQPLDGEVDTVSENFDEVFDAALGHSLEDKKLLEPSLEADGTDRFLEELQQMGLLDLAQIVDQILELEADALEGGELSEEAIAFWNAASKIVMTDQAQLSKHVVQKTDLLSKRVVQLLESLVSKLKVKSESQGLEKGVIANVDPEVLVEEKPSFSAQSEESGIDSNQKGLGEKQANHDSVLKAMSSLLHNQQVASVAEQGDEKPKASKTPEFVKDIQNKEVEKAIDPKNITLEKNNEETQRVVNVESTEQTRSIRKDEPALKLNKVASDLRTKTLQKLQQGFEFQTKKAPLPQDMADLHKKLTDYLKTLDKKTLSEAKAQLSAKSTLVATQLNTQKAVESPLSVQIIKPDLDNTVEEESKKKRNDVVEEGSKRKVSEITNTRVSKVYQAPVQVLAQSKIAESILSEYLPIEAPEPSVEVKEIKIDAPKIDPGTTALSDQETKDTTIEKAQSQKAVLQKRMDPELMQKFINSTKKGLELWIEKKFVAMKIQVDPPELGRLQLKTVIEAGKIGALIQAESQAAKELLIMHLDEMKEVLEEQGLEIAGFNVEVAQQGFEDTENQFKSKRTAEFNMETLLGEEEAQGSEAPSYLSQGYFNRVA